VSVSMPATTGTRVWPSNDRRAALNKFEPDAYLLGCKKEMSTLAASKKDSMITIIIPTNPPNAFRSSPIILQIAYPTAVNIRIPIETTSTISHMLSKDAFRISYAFRWSRDGTDASTNAPEQSRGVSCKKVLKERRLI
jgi:hypothetical protein